MYLALLSIRGPTDTHNRSGSFAVKYKTHLFSFISHSFIICSNFSKVGSNFTSFITALKPLSLSLTCFFMFSVLSLFFLFFSQSSISLILLLFCLIKFTSPLIQLFFSLKFDFLPSNPLSLFSFCSTPVFFLPFFFKITHRTAPSYQTTLLI